MVTKGFAAQLHFLLAAHNVQVMWKPKTDRLHNSRGCAVVSLSTKIPPSNG